MSSNTNNLYNELKMIAKMGNNIRQRNPRKQTSKIYFSSYKWQIINDIEAKG